MQQVVLVPPPIVPIFGIEPPVELRHRYSRICDCGGECVRRFRTRMIRGRGPNHRHTSPTLLPHLSTFGVNPNREKTIHVAASYAKSEGSALPYRCPTVGSAAGCLLQKLINPMGTPDIRPETLRTPICVPST